MRELKFKIFDKTDTKKLIGPFDWNRLPSFDYPEIFDVVQFTGLKDKNGVEIYEGDIVSWDGGRYIGEVELKDNHGWKPKDLFNRNWWEDAEVIGNIFENPELIK